MRYQDKKYWYFLLLWIFPVCLLVVGCAVDNSGSVASTTETNHIPLETVVSSIIAVTASPTTSLLPTTPSALSPVPIVLPVTTMLPQEAEDALQDLLKTNGNCTGKCLAGIYPDEMTMQEGVDQMAQWSMLSVDEDNDGRTFVHVVPPALSDKQIRINLVLILRQQIIDGVSFYIPRRIDGAEFVDADVWLANRETWEAFQLDNLLKAYGTPSFVGFFMETRGTEGESIAYTLDIQYEQMNLKIGIGGLAHRNGQDVIICPSKDPHSLGIDINPERPLREIQQFSPITWQALTGSDLQTFHHTFTNESSSDGCVVITLSKIIELDPYFR